MFEVQERLLMSQEGFFGENRNSPDPGETSPRKKTPVTIHNARIMALPEIEK
jgi:hypothetical protein